MVNAPLFLAQSDSAPVSSDLLQQLDILHHPDVLLDKLQGMPIIAAATCVVVGILCVFNGYRWHKWVVAILAFIAGIALGHALSAQMGRPTVVAGAVGCLCAIVATPLLKLSVAIFGGATGAFIGANIWTALGNTPPDTQWAGALIGFVILAMGSMILYRLVVVLFTSVGGAAMAVFGGITLLLGVPNWEQTIRESLVDTPMLVPLLVSLAAVGGFVLQQSRLRADGVKLFANDAKTN